MKPRFGLTIITLLILLSIVLSACAQAQPTPAPTTHQSHQLSLLSLLHLPSRLQPKLPRLRLKPRPYRAACRRARDPEDHAQLRP